MYTTVGISWCFANENVFDLCTLEGERNQQSVIES